MGNHINRFIFYCFIFAALFQVNSATGSVFTIEPDQPQKPHVSYEFLIDKTNKISIEDINSSEIQKNFTPSNQDKSFGYFYDTIWSKLSIKNGDPENNAFILGLDYPPLDEVDFFMGGSQIKCGDSLPFSIRAIQHVSCAMEITIPYQQEKIVYVKTKTKGSAKLIYRIEEKQSWFNTKQREEFLYGIFYGTLLIMMIYNLFLGVISREKNYIHYATFIFFLLMVNSTLFGHFAKYLTQDHAYLNNFITPLFVPAVFIQNSFFAQNYLELGKYFKKLSLFIKVATHLQLTVAITGFIAVVFNTDFYGIHLQFNIILGVLSLFFFLITSSLLIAKGAKHAIYYVISWSSLFISGIIYQLIDIGVLPILSFSESFLLAGCILNIIFLSFGQGVKIKEVLNHQVKQSKLMEKIAISAKKINSCKSLEKLKSESESLLGQLFHSNMSNSLSLNSCYLTRQKKEEESLSIEDCFKKDKDYIHIINERQNNMSLGFFHFRKEMVSQGNLNQEDIAFILDNFSNSIVNCLMNIEANKEKEEKQKLLSEIKATQFVQENLIPQSTLHSQGSLNILGHFLPLEVCGGDWWSFFPLSTEEVLILVGDVKGHGISSAFITAIVKGYCDALYNRKIPSLDKLLLELNTVVGNSSSGEISMTMAAVKINTEKNTIQFANAGHNFPLIYRKNSQRVKQMPLSGSRLGTKNSKPADLSYKTKTDYFYPGDTLILFTDGVTEWSNESGEELGTTRLKKLIENQCQQDYNIQEKLDNIFKQIKSFSGFNSSMDDTTFIIIEYSKIPSLLDNKQLKVS